MLFASRRSDINWLTGMDSILTSRLSLTDIIKFNSTLTVGFGQPFFLFLVFSAQPSYCGSHIRVHICMYTMSNNERVLQINVLICFLVANLSPSLSLSALCLFVLYIFLWWFVNFFRWALRLFFMRIIHLFVGQFLPHHVGIPMGGRTGPKYYMLEIHYDNPTAKKGLFIYIFFNTHHIRTRTLYIYIYISNTEITIM